MPNALPTSTVTFLFTDVQGSTELLHTLGAADYARALGEHRRILREIFGARGGVEVDTQGDAFFVAFPTAAGAVGAASDAQRALSGGPIQVRIGIHTGTPHLADGGYVGADVHRAARIAAAAHGGQIVISEATWSLVRNSLPGTVTTRDLGAHRFKDFSDAEHVRQLVIDGLRSDFPPLRSIDRVPNNLPPQLTAFIGRQRVEAVTSLIRDGTRLLTLTGPGGSGKTRLAIEAASDLVEAFADGVFWVPLSAITDSSLVGPAIATSFGLHDTGSRPVAERLGDHLREKTVLLVLDTFEQLLPAAPLLNVLLRAAPGLKIITSSRSPLRLYGERELPVPPLTLADPAATIEAVSGSESVRLFSERATAIRPDFQVTSANARTIAEICKRLDGLPLAIELAAAQVRILPADAILRRLGGALDLLSSGSRDLPHRQRTLRAAIGWSYDLLDAATRMLFARLAVFAGGAWLDEVQAVCGADSLGGLMSLVDHSLLEQREVAGEPRFQTLDTIREYAAEQLALTGEAEMLRRRHAEVYLAVAARVQRDLTGQRQGELLDALERDHDNLRAATEWAIVHDPGLAMRLVGTMWRFSHMRGHLNEAEATAVRVLALPHEDLAPDRLQALDGAGGIAYWQGDMDRARARYQEALEIAAALGDRSQVVDQAYNLSFTYQVGPTDLPQALALSEQALRAYRELGDRAGIAKALSGYAFGLYQLDDRSRARPVLDECITLMRELNDRFGLACGLEVDALIDMKDGLLEDARSSLAEALRIFAAAGDMSGVMLLLMDTAVLAALRGDLDRAVRLFAACEMVRDLSGATLADTIETRQLPAVDLVREATARLTEARDAGRRLSREDAIALALS